MNSLEVASHLAPSLSARCCGGLTSRTSFCERRRNHLSRRSILSPHNPVMCRDHPEKALTQTHSPVFGDDWGGTRGRAGSYSFDEYLSDVKTYVQMPSDAEKQWSDKAAPYLQLAHLQEEPRHQGARILRDAASARSRLTADPKAASHPSESGDNTTQS